MDKKEKLPKETQIVQCHKCDNQIEVKLGGPIEQIGGWSFNTDRLWYCSRCTIEEGENAIQACGED